MARAWHDGGVTVPTPSSHNPDPSHPSPHADGGPGGQSDAGHPQAPPPAAPPVAPPSYLGEQTGAGAEGAVIVRRELRDAALSALGVAVAGVLMGLVWMWLAPRVPLFTDGRAVYLKDPEGEEAMGADGTFALLGLAFGAVTGVLVYFLRRHGGVGLVAGLVAGGVLASLLAWRTGVWLGPNTDVIAAAKEAGKNATFDAPLKIQAKGVLLTWPFAAVAFHLLFTAIFLPADEPPGHRRLAIVQAPPDWEGDGATR